MKLNLVVLTEGRQKGKLLPIALAQFLIGRDPQCNLRPASPLISKRHCAILQRDDKVYVRDFDSTNGTFVNELPLKGEIEVKNKDYLKVGPISFQVQIEADAVVNRPTPPPPTKTSAGKPPAKADDGTKVPNPGALPAKKGPAKPPVKAPVADAGSDDDDVAAMLLSLQDDDSGGTPYVPEGSTVFDMPMPPPGEGDKPKSDADKDKEKAKQHQGNTASAAKSILEKMMRRPRG